MTERKRICYACENESARHRCARHAAEDKADEVKAEDYRRFAAVKLPLLLERLVSALEQIAENGK